jgi:hypothetical protein
MTPTNMGGVETATSVQSTRGFLPGKSGCGAVRACARPGAAPAVSTAAEKAAASATENLMTPTAMATTMGAPPCPVAAAVKALRPTSERPTYVRHEVQDHGTSSAWWSMRVAVAVAALSASAAEEEEGVAAGGAEGIVVVVVAVVGDDGSAAAVEAERRRRTRAASAAAAPLRRRRGARTIGVRAGSAGVAAARGVWVWRAQFKAPGQSRGLIEIRPGLVSARV